MREVTAYKTEDGKLFYNKEEAANHEFKLQEREAVSVLVDRIEYLVNEGPDWTESAIDRILEYLSEKQNNNLEPKSDVKLPAIEIEKAKDWEYIIHHNSTPHSKITRAKKILGKYTWGVSPLFSDEYTEERSYTTFPEALIDVLKDEVNLSFIYDLMQIHETQKELES